MAGLTRRAALAGGAAALLAGCGEEDEPAAPRPADALLRSLAAERALAAGAPARVAARARERATRLAAAVAEQGGRPHASPASGAAGEAVALARAALTAHVTALPALPSRDLRALAAELITGAAADLEVLGAPADDPFPGTPA